MLSKSAITDDPELRAVFARTFRDILKKIINEAQSYYEFIDNLSEKGFRFNSSGKIIYSPDKNKNEHIEFDIDADLHLQSNFEMMIERIKKNIQEKKKRRDVTEVYISEDLLKDFFSEEDFNDEADTFIAQETANNREKYKQQLTKFAENKKSEAKHTKGHTHKR
jgi:hypothetical protein